MNLNPFLPFMGNHISNCNAVTPRQQPHTILTDNTLSYSLYQRR